MSEQEDPFDVVRLKCGRWRMTCFKCGRTSTWKTENAAVEDGAHHDCREHV